MRLMRHQGRLPAPPRLGLHPRDRQVRPEGPLLGLVEIRRDQALLDLALKLDRLLRAGIQGEEAWSLPAGDAERLPDELDGRGGAVHRKRLRGDLLDVLLRLVAEEDQ